MIRLLYVSNAARDLDARAVSDILRVSRENNSRLGITGMQVTAIEKAARCCAGVTAIEFALLAPIFLGLFFAIAETGFTLLGQSMLQNSVNNASRLIKTGQVEAQGIGASQFRNVLCEGMVVLPCNDGLVVNVQAFASFSAAGYRPPVKSTGEVDTNQDFQAGKPGEIVLVRAVYRWKIITPFIGMLLANAPSGERLIIATAAFRNEER